MLDSEAPPIFLNRIYKGLTDGTQDFINSMTRNLEDIYKTPCPLHNTQQCNCKKSLRLTRGRNSSTITEDGVSHTSPAHASNTAHRGSVSVARDMSNTPRGSMADISMAHRGSLGLEVRSASTNAITARSAIHSFLRYGLSCWAGVMFSFSEISEFSHSDS